MIDQDNIGNVMESYYKELFLSSNSNLEDDSLEKIPCMVTDEMNGDLIKEFTELEVKEALNQMASLKALGPDDMPSLFYQHFWSTMQHGVTSAILSWLNSDDSLLFCRSITEDCNNVLKLLGGYES